MAQQIDEATWLDQRGEKDRLLMRCDGEKVFLQNTDYEIIFIPISSWDEVKDRIDSIIDRSQKGGK